MATLDLSTAHRGFSMTDPNLVSFNRAYQADPGAWLFNTPDGHALRLSGNGLTYDALGRAQTGFINSLTIDLGNDNPWNPDIKIAGINAAAPRLDDGPAEFWHFLEGNDTIYGPSVAQGASAQPFTLVGDGVAARPGPQVGGSDVFHAGDGHVTIYGDVDYVGHPDAGSPTSTYRGGDDQILGLETSKPQSLFGDAGSVWAGSKLTGGRDTILIQATTGSIAAGDAHRVTGAAGLVTEVIGGNDDITAGPNFRGILAGDVGYQRPGSLVRGGADTIRGGELAEIIVGDTYRMETARLIGGNDTLSGNGGNDTIYGDSYQLDGPNTITGGHDVIDGGRGYDTIVGDFGSVSVGGNDRLSGGEGYDKIHGNGGDDVLNGGQSNDQLWGEDGRDELYGGTENDQLSGGARNDLLDGGAGDDYLRGDGGSDTYYVNSFSDRVIEEADAGVDTVWSTSATTVLGANVENLVSIGVFAFTGVGNGLDNRIIGGALTDDLRGEDGNDVLIGGVGADLLQGGAGTDTASYANATTGGVYASLQGNANGSRDARGDVYVGVENLAGSDFGDALYGDGGANRLSGGAGNDGLVGHGGADTLLGGAGQDGLTGGGGNDAFVFNAPAEGRDTVYDFGRLTGNDDRLLFEGDAFGGLPMGALSASRFVANTSGLATTSDQRFVFETDTGVLRFDSNGTAAGGVTEIALFTEPPVLTAADFFII